MGKRFSEEKIIGVASAYQKATSDKGFENRIPEEALREEG
jgi:aspartyl-tRNA(Asn)/glutamyl-tRNA(Gln) amidotransferase subunit A